MDPERPRPNPERKIARTRAELPSLKADHARVVHLTHTYGNVIDDIIQGGLKYKVILGTTARTWSKAEDAVYDTTDPRFSGPTVVAVVMDVPIDEHRLHETVGKAPGRIPPEYIVGVIPSEK